MIRGLAVVVGLNMVVALIAVYAHAGDATDRESRSRQAAATSSSTSPGILSGGHFTKRRGTGTTATSGTTVGTSGSTGAASTGPNGNGSGGTGPGTPGTTGASGPAGAAASGSAPTTGPSGAGASNHATTTTSARATTSTSGDATTTTSGRTTPTTSSAPAGAGTGANNHAGALSDPAGDTVVDGTTDPVKEGRADIVSAGAAYGPGGLTFTMQVAQPDDPRTDTKWAADSTFANWSVDTNGDGKPDYDIQFTRDGNDLTGDVSQPGDNGASVCDASSATYGPNGYSVTVDPACLGNPPSVAFRATMYYDTNPKNDNSDVASDVAPNGGLSFPVARPS